MAKGPYSRRGGKRERRSGQAMLIAVLSLGGAILGATAVAGLLTLYQLRATTDSENSAKSIFAADSGVELALFDYYCGLATPKRACPSDAGQSTASRSFSASQASVVINCYDASGKSSACNNASTTVSALTLGTSGNTKRAFSLSFVGPPELP